MRFLCLHGMGTNADIFELQTAPLRYLLPEQHEFEFIHGSLSDVEPAAGVDAVFGKQEEYYQYFDSGLPGSVLKAVQDLAEFCETYGPFDGVWGFSQGAGLAATILAARNEGFSLKGGSRLPDFKVAVLFSATRPFDLHAAQSGRIELLSSQQKDATVQLRTTTVHFWDPSDTAYPGMSEEVYAMSDPRCRLAVRHKAGHGIPPASDDQLKEMAQAIQEGFGKIETTSRPAP